MPLRRATPWFLLLAAIVVCRSAVFVAWPAAHFDSDQAITGLMAKHLAEARAFPVFWYGQTYMLAVEAWLAAPLMAIAGASVAALKLPLLAINVAIVWLLLRGLTRDAGLAAHQAAFAALFFVLAPPITAAHFLTANGGNVEPALYVLLLWTLRRRPLWMGLVLGVGFLNREFTIYGAVALLILDAAERRLFTPSALTRYAVAFATATAVWLAFLGLRQFSSAAGPGTSVADLHSRLAGNNLLQVAERLCSDVPAMVVGAGRILTVHWPELFGLEPQPLTDFGIESGVRQGLPGSAWLLLPMLALPLLDLGVRSVKRHLPGARSVKRPLPGARSADRPFRGQAPGAPFSRPGLDDGTAQRPGPQGAVQRPGPEHEAVQRPDPRAATVQRPGTGDTPVHRPGTGDAPDSRPDPRFPRYLIIVSALSLTGYVVGRCGAVDFYTMRYELLSVLGAAGLAARYLQVERARALTAIWAAGCIAVFALAAVAHVRLLNEYLTQPPVALKRELVRALEARGIRYGAADYWTAYYVTFMTRERIIVTATEIPRIKAYARLVDEHRSEAILISRRPCPGGDRLSPGFWQCTDTNR